MVGVTQGIGSTMVPVRTVEEVLTPRPREERSRLRRHAEAVTAREAGESEAAGTSSAHTPKVRQS